MFGRKSVPKHQENPVALRSAAGSEALTTKVPLKNLQILQGPDGDGVVFVGKGTEVTGEFSNCSLVEVHGQLEGTVSTNAMVIREGGLFKGDARTEQADVEGQVDGRLTVHGLLDVRATGRISGDVAYEKLVVAEGGIIGGTLQSPATIESEVAQDSTEVNGTAVNGHAGEWDNDIKTQLN